MILLHTTFEAIGESLKYFDIILNVAAVVVWNFIKCNISVQGMFNYIREYIPPPSPLRRGVGLAVGILKLIYLSFILPPLAPSPQQPSFYKILYIPPRLLFPPSSLNQSRKQ